MYLQCRIFINIFYIGTRALITHYLSTGKVWGSLSAPPVLCVHGIQDNANSFDRLISLLPPSLCYVAIDLPGHGRSSHLPAGMMYSLFDYCMTITRVKNHFDWKHFTYMGHSLGGQIGFLYSSFYPQQVVKLVILDALLPYHNSYEDITDGIPKLHTKLLSMEKNMASKIPPSYSEEEALRRLTEGRPIPLTQEAAQALFSRGVSKNGEGYIFTADQRLKLRSLSFFTKEQCLTLISRIQCPVYIVRASVTDIYIKSIGYDDNDEFGNLLRVSLGEKYVHKLVKGSHDVHLLHPKRFSSDLYNFLIKLQSSL